MGFWSSVWELAAKVPPWEIINEAELGVRMRFGKFTTRLGPGIHWRVPVIHEIQSLDCKEQIIDLPSQLVGDIVVEATIRYCVDDPRLALLEVQDYDLSLINFTLGLIGSILSRVEIEDGEQLREEIKEDLQIEAKGWGLDVMDVNIKTFANKTRSFKLFGEV